MHPNTTRRSLRALHLLASAALGAFVYSPWRDAAPLALAVQWIAFPALALSGLSMWLGPRWRARWRAMPLSGRPAGPRG